MTLKLLVCWNLLKRNNEKPLRLCGKDFLNNYYGSTQAELHLVYIVNW